MINYESISNRLNEVLESYSDEELALWFENEDKADQVREALKFSGMGSHMINLLIDSYSQNLRNSRFDEMISLHCFENFTNNFEVGSFFNIGKFFIHNITVREKNSNRIILVNENFTKDNINYEYENKAA